MVLFGLTGSEDLRFFETNKSYLSIRKNAKVQFQGDAKIGTHFSLLVCGNMTFGKRFSSNHGCSFSCMEKISMGEDVLLGGQVTMRDTDGHTLLYDGKADTKNVVSIGSHVWICSKVDVLRGTTIGNNSVVGYRSLCNKRYESDDVLIAGIPAKICKHNVSWTI